MGTITTTGCLTLFRDDGGNGIYAEIHVPSATSLEAVQTFATVLAGYTTAKITEISWTQTIAVDDIPGSDAENQSLTEYAALSMRGDGHTKQFRIPAPNEELFITDDAGKTILSETKGTAFAEAYSALTGKTYQFIKGRFA